MRDAYRPRLVFLNLSTFQVVVSLIAGSVIEWIGSPNATIYLASVLGMISAFSASKVFYSGMD